MVPVDGGGSIYINGVNAIEFDWHRTLKGVDWFPMWACDGQPLGLINQGCYLIECVVAHLLVSGRLTPQWEQVPGGMRLTHPRYTLAVTQRLQGWLPTISDELTRRSHSLAVQRTCIDAMNVLDALLQRRISRELPDFDWGRWSYPYEETSEEWQFQLALELAGPVIADLIRHGSSTPVQWNGQPPECAKKLAGFLDKVCRLGKFDPAPKLATIIATYIKYSLISLYRGGRSIAVTPHGFPVTFTDADLRAFRNRFRQALPTDGEYLAFAMEYFIAPLGELRRRRVRRWSGYRPFDPETRVRSIRWTRKPGTRLFAVHRAPVARGHAALGNKVA